MKNRNDPSCTNCIFEYTCGWNQDNDRLVCDRWIPDLNYRIITENKEYNKN